AMPPTDLHIAACATWLPPTMTADEALTRGLTDRRTITTTGATAVAVSRGHSGPEMAAAAGRTALDRAGPHHRIDLLLHASFYYQGHDLWAPASYVHHHCLTTPSPAIEIRQVS
ncbi:3-oxoacyl-ACP synthase, partial [Marinitenerispora sediminis]